MKTNNFYPANLEKIIDICRVLKKATEKVSEVDTQVLLIEPILTLAGIYMYDYNSVKRAVSGKSHVDLICDVGNNKLFVECKSINETIHKNNHGGLFLTCLNFKQQKGRQCDEIHNGKYKIKNSSEKIICNFCNRKGTSKCCWEQGYWNRATDSIGQLRQYCVNAKNKEKELNVLPILTNGETWMLFKPKFYKNLEEPITTDCYEKIQIEEKGFLKKMHVFCKPA